MPTISKKYLVDRIEEKAESKRIQVLLSSCFHLLKSFVNK